MSEIIPQSYPMWMVTECFHIDHKSETFGKLFHTRCEPVVGWIKATDDTIGVFFSPIVASEEGGFASPDDTNKSDAEGIFIRKTFTTNPNHPLIEKED